MKFKLFSILFLSLFLISFASAFDFDNTYEYNPTTKTAYIHNCDFWLGTCFNQGEVLAEATLTWGDTTVRSGTDVHVGSFNYTPMSANAEMQDLDLVNLKNGQTMTRGKQYKVLTYKEDDNFIPECTDNILVNGTIIQDCILVEDGKKLVEEWVPLSNPNFNFALGETYTIGVFVDTVDKDYFDWVPTLAGLEIKEWATVSVTDLITYLKLDENAASTTVEDSHGSKTWTASTNTNNLAVSGIINTGFEMLYANSEYASSSYDYTSDIGSGDFTISFWYKPTTISTNQRMIYQVHSTPNRGLYITSDGTTGDEILVGLFGTGGTPTYQTSGLNMVAGNTYFIIVKRTSGTLKIIVNDVEKVSTTETSGNIANTGTNTNMFLGVDRNLALFVNCMIDEVAIFSRATTSTEDTALYNSGSGLAYPFETDSPPVITNPLPANNTVYTTTTTVNFNWTATDDIKLLSTALYIDGSLETNRTSSINGTLQTYSKSLSSGIHNWSLIAFDNSSQNTTAGPYFVNISISTPTVTLQSPADDIFVNNVTQELIGYVVSDLTVANVSLYVNGSLIETNSSGLNATNYTFTHTFSAGTSTWYMRSCNNLGFCADSATRTINEDLDNVTINTTLLTPIIYAFGDNVSVNFTATDSFLDSCGYSYITSEPGNFTGTLSVYPQGKFWNYTSNTTSLSTGDIYIKTLFGSGLLGSYIIDNVSATGTWTRLTDEPICNFSDLGRARVGLYGGIGGTNTGKYFCVKDENDNYYINKIGAQAVEQVSLYWDVVSLNNLPCTSGVEQTVNITSVEGYTDITFYANHSIGDIFSNTVTFAYDSVAPNATIVSPALFGDYGYDGQNTTFNYSIQDVNLDSCWYNYNGTNVTTPCTSGFYNTTYFTLIEGNSNLTLYANDTVGNLMSEFYEWDYKVFQGPQVYSATARSGNLETYYTNVTMGTGYELASSSLVYEGEYTTPTIFSTGQLRALTAEYVPLTTVDVNNTFFWNLVLTDGTEINSTNQTQLVTAIYLDDCSNYTFELFNLSLVDEELQTALNGTIELGFTLQNKPYYDSVNTRYIKLEGVNTTRVCSDVNLTNENLAFSAEIRYFATDYAAELYHIQRADLEGEVYNITLYDLNDNDSTEFKITYQDSNFNFVDDAIIQLQRKYIDEGVYKVVEAPLTSADGVAVVHIDLNSIKYKATVVKNGEVLNTFDNIVFVCASELTGECTQALLGEVDSINEKSVNTERDFSYSVTRVNNTVTIPFTIPSTVASSVNIVLTQQDQFGNTTLCNKTVISSAGSIDCTFNDSIGDSYLTLQIYKNGIPMAYTTYIIPESGVVDFLGNNYIIVVLLMLSLVGLALTSPEWMIINGIVTFFVAGALWLVSGTNFVAGLGLMMWLVIAAGIIIFKLAKQDDR